MKTGKYSDQLAELGGARADALTVVSGARIKFVVMGAMLLVTSTIAAISASFALHMALDEVPVLLAVAGGLAWGAAILIIDRALIVSMDSRAPLWQTLTMAVARLLLAGVLGTVVSTPLTLQLFDQETAAEVRVIQRESADAFAQSLAKDEQFAQIPGLEKQVADARARIVSGGSSDPVAAAMQSTYDDAFAEYLRLQQKAQCELDGSCGTGRAGEGGAYFSAQTAAERQLAVVNSLKRELDAARATSVSDAQSQLDQLQSRLDKLTGDRQQLMDEFAQRNSDNTGLLIRLEALERIGEKHSVLGLAHKLLWAAFLFIELLPVLTKLFMNAGANRDYDRARKAIDASDADVLEGQVNAWKQVQQEKAQAGVEVERDRIEKEKQQGFEINDKVIETTGKSVKAAIEVWGRHAEQMSSERIAEFERELAAGQVALPSVNGHQHPGPQRTGKFPNPAHRGRKPYLQAADMPEEGVL